MKLLAGTLAMLTTLANAQAAPLETRELAQQANAQDPQSAPPRVPSPRDAPPPPPSERPEPPSDPPAPPPEHATPDGQWVHTSQYGWVWMPYGEQFTHAPSGGGTPNMYVYYPEAGWCWVMAPWLWGWGPMPYFGLVGPRYFGWYGHGLGRWYGFSGRYDRRGGYGRGYWSGGRWSGIGHSTAGPGRSSAPAPRGSFRGRGNPGRSSGSTGHRR